MVSVSFYLMSTDKRLIKKAQRGEVEAFGTLYDEYLTPIYSFVLLRVRHKSDAEDITQQVFLSAWKNIERYELRDNIPFSSWLYRIARNAVIDHYRTQREHVDIESLSEQLSADVPELEQILDDTFQLQEVKRALNALGADEQDVLIMRFINELSSKEVADVLDKSEGAVRVVQHRALKKLKRELD